MSANDELHRLLDERGVEHQDYEFSPDVKTTSWDIDTSDPRYEVCAAFEEFDGGTTLLRFWNPTPEQAVEATLGPLVTSSNCSNSERTTTVDETDTWECVCDQVGRYGKCVTIHVMECSACGGTYEHVNGSYEFCPRCGRRVEVDE